MRLFVALRPSRAAVVHLQAALAGRPTSPPEQWHVTLAFLGEVADPTPVAAGLGPAAAAGRPIELHLRGSGAFRGARAVWTGVGGDVTGLAALAAAVHACCRDAGVALERRRFRPHLTIGNTGKLAPQVLADYCGPPWRATEVELVQSVLGRTAVHTVLQRFPLYQA